MGQFHCLLNKGIIPLSIFSSVELQQVTRSSARLTIVSEADERDGSSKQKTLAASLTNALAGRRHLRRRQEGYHRREHEMNTRRSSRVRRRADVIGAGSDGVHAPISLSINRFMFLSVFLG